MHRSGLSENGKITIDVEGSTSIGEIEKQKPELAGALRRTCDIFPSMPLKKASELAASLDCGAFGRFSQYFLSKFPLTERLTDGGEPGVASATTRTAARGVNSSGRVNQYHPPASIAQILTEAINPHHGRCLDAACGSGGRVVSSARSMGVAFCNTQCSLY